MAHLLGNLQSYAWTDLSVVIWMLFFLGLVVWVYRPKSRCTYEQYGRLPLGDHSAPENSAKMDRKTESSTGGESLV